MTETPEVPATYNEPGPGQYSVEEHLKAQQEQTSAGTGDPLHPELSDESNLTDPSQVGAKGPGPLESGQHAEHDE